MRDRERDREDFGAQSPEAVPTAVTIAVGGALTSKDLHTVLKQELGFPDFYGMNWDAFWDSITGLVDIPDRIVFTGWPELVCRLPRDAELLRQCLDEYQSECCQSFSADFE